MSKYALFYVLAECDLRERLMDSKQEERRIEKLWQTWESASKMAQTVVHNVDHLKNKYRRKAEMAAFQLTGLYSLIYV